jgi:hypothetical protein
MTGAQTLGEFLLYQTEEAYTRIQVRLVNGQLWLSQQQLADLYQTSTQNITQHIRAIYKEAELSEEATCKPYLQVRQEGARTVSRNIKHYNLEMLLAIGYRVHSHRGTQFRQWATEVLQGYTVKGFAMDDERLMAPESDAYFEELLARIRNIRNSEKVFWRKVLDIFATSIDYDGKTETAKAFFATVQNKLHWAAHEHTAAEVVFERADASKPNMGLLSWIGSAKGKAFAKSDVTVAKNYLTEEELAVLNRIVMAYLEVAELQAQARKPMTMQDWKDRLDDFIRMTGKDVLSHAGVKTAEAAKAKAEAEYARYLEQQQALPNKVEQDFYATLQAPVEMVKNFDQRRKTRKVKKDS